MTPGDLVLATMAGQPTPRRAFTLTLSLYGAKLTQCPLETYFRDPAAYVRGQEAVLELCEPDILFTPFASVLEAEAFGAPVRFAPQNAPTLVAPAARTVDDFLRLQPPSGDDPRLVYFREAARQLVTLSGKERPVCGLLASPVDLPTLILSLDHWLEILITDPNGARRILEVTSRHFVAQANALFDEGVSFIALSMSLNNPAILFPQLLKDLLSPVLRQAFAQVKGPIVYHHGGNRLIPQLEEARKLPQVGAFVVDPRDSFQEARRIVGPQAVLMGNLPGPTLARGTLEQTKTRVRVLLDSQRDDPRFLLASSGADIAYDTPPEYLKAIAEVVRGG